MGVCVLNPSPAPAGDRILEPSDIAAKEDKRGFPTFHPSRVGTLPPKEETERESAGKIVYAGAMPAEHYRRQLKE